MALILDNLMGLLYKILLRVRISSQINQKEKEDLND